MINRRELITGSLAAIALPISDCAPTAHKTGSPVVWTQASSFWLVAWGADGLEKIDMAAEFPPIKWRGIELVRYKKPLNI